MGLDVFLSKAFEKLLAYSLCLYKYLPPLALVAFHAGVWLKAASKLWKSNFMLTKIGTKQTERVIYFCWDGKYI